MLVQQHLTQMLASEAAGEILLVNLCEVISAALCTIGRMGPYTFYAGVLLGMVWLWTGAEARDNDCLTLVKTWSRL